jgi:hypothetical protein
MTTDELETMFDIYSDEYYKFERVENKKSTRPDLHAFLLLDSLLPDKRDMVCSAEHDQIWLDPDIEELANIITEEQVIELIRCGVMYEEDSLTMFV